MPRDLHVWSRSSYQTLLVDIKFTTSCRRILKEIKSNVWGIKKKKRGKVSCRRKSRLVFQVRPWLCHELPDTGTPEAVRHAIPSQCERQVSQRQGNVTASLISSPTVHLLRYTTLHHTSFTLIPGVRWRPSRFRSRIMVGIIVRLIWVLICICKHLRPLYRGSFYW